MSDKKEISKEEFLKQYDVISKSKVPIFMQMSATGLNLVTRMLKIADKKRYIKEHNIKILNGDTTLGDSNARVFYNDKSFKVIPLFEHIK